MQTRNRKQGKSKRQLLVGWSTQDITPDQPVNLMGQFHVRISQSVYDPITVTALAIEDHPKGDRVIMVSCDHSWLSDRVVKQVRAKIGSALPGFDPEDVIINTTHTHNAPALEDFWYPQLGPEVMSPADYREFFCEQAAKAAAKAWKDRKPAGLSWAFGNATVGHNRRLAYLDGTAEMYGQSDREDFAGPEGPEDPAVDMIFTWDQRRKLTGVVVNLACPSQTSEGAYCVTADFWHEARAEIRKRLGKNVFVLPLCGAAGDQSPHVLLHRRVEPAMRKRSGLTLRQQIGARIGAAVASAFPVARKDIRTDLPFRHAGAVLRLSRRAVTKAEYRLALGKYKKLADDRSLDGRPASDKAASTRVSEMGYEKHVIDRFERGNANKWETAEVHVCRIGDVALATNPCELFLEYGLRIKERSPAVQTLVVELTGPFRYYLPTPRAVAGGGYSAIIHDNRISPKGGRELVEKTLRMIKRIWE
ncbi:MAG: hypothetical protein PHW60_11935 [Kiritimatiellae bacterium]|nr:hypothetical protein [Kiritimatiellia bacterium]